MAYHVFRLIAGASLLFLTRISIIHSLLTTEAAETFCPKPIAIENGDYEVVDQNGSLLQNIEKIPFGATANYNCQRGYVTSEDSSAALLCNEGGWSSQAPHCIARHKDVKICPTPPPLAHGSFALKKGNVVDEGGKLVEEGDAVFYWCEAGYKLEGSEELVCNRGHWAGIHPVCIGCGQPPHIKNGDYVRFLGEQVVNPGEQTDSMPEGSKVYYYCHNDYRLHDPNSQVLTCEDGIWQGNLPVCDKRTHCDPPMDIDHGNWILQEGPVSNIREYTMYRIGTNIIYECEEHYHLVGAGSIECDVSGYWSDRPPRCLPKDLYCDEPQHVEHGTYLCKPHACNLFEIGTEVHYICNAHYMPRPGDQDVQMCTIGGEWSGSPPVCLQTAAMSEETRSDLHINTGTLTVVIATSCGVLGLLLLVMLLVALQRRLNLPTPTLSHPAQATPPLYSQQQDTVTAEEQDRVALIAFADGVQVVLPSYDEAVRGHTGPHLSRFSSDSSRSSRGSSGRATAEYRPLPSIPGNLRASQLPPDLMHRDHHRNSIITTTSTTTRDNVSIAFGSVDTMNVSDGTSTTVTIGTYDSAGSNPSIATSQRAVAGSLASSISHGSIATDGPAP